MKNLLFLAAFLIVSSGSFADDVQLNKLGANQVSVLKAELDSFNLGKPEEDLERNLSQGNRQFMSVCGYACECPGVSKDDYGYVQQYGSQIIKGTSDVVEGNEHLKLIGIASSYAEQYNIALLKKLKQANK